MRRERSVLYVSLLIAFSVSSIHAAAGGVLSPGIYRSVISSSDTAKMTVAKSGAGNTTFIHESARGRFSGPLGIVCSEFHTSFNHNIPANYNMASPITGTGTCGLSECSGGHIACAIGPPFTMLIFKQITPDQIDVTMLQPPGDPPYLLHYKRALHISARELKNKTLAIEGPSPFVVKALSVQGIKSN
jgi:hypothetical protein